MAEEIALIKIIPEGFSSSSSGGSSGGVGASSSMNVGGMAKGLLNGLKAMLQGIGFASLILVVAKIAGSLSGLMNIVGAILKSIGLILKPIADVIMVLLMPILVVLKPIMMAVNQFLQPFIKLAMDAFRLGAEKLKEGDKAGAVNAFAGSAVIMINGLTGIVVMIFSEVLKLVTDMVAGFLKSVVDIIVGITSAVLTAFDGIFGFNAEEAIGKLNVFGENIKTGIDTTAEFAKEKIDLGKNLLLGSLIDSSAAVGDQIGISTTDFEIAAIQAVTGSISTDPSNITSTFVDEFGKFGKSAVSVIQKIMNEAKDAVEDIGDDVSGVFDRIKDKELIKNFDKRKEGYYSPTTRFIVQ